MARVRTPLASLGDRLQWATTVTRAVGQNSAKTSHLLTPPSEDEPCDHFDRAVRPFGLAGE